ncbi:MAG: hypothetical protein M0Z94_00765 [Dehalococcoidales bacterium]|nr:hypothetical protein [Dehalococcoidales bacterium]
MMAWLIIGIAVLAFVVGATLAGTYTFAGVFRGQRGRLLSVAVLVAVAAVSLSLGAQTRSTVAYLQLPTANLQAPGNSIQVPCVIGNVANQTCEIDTGNGIPGVLMSQSLLAQVGGTQMGQQNVAGVAGSVPATTEMATITIGDRSQTVTIYGAQGWNGPILVGPYVLSQLYGSMTIDFKDSLLRLGGVRLVSPSSTQIGQDNIILTPPVQPTGQVVATPSPQPRLLHRDLGE